jgi:hypothetical protein
MKKAAATTQSNAVCEESRVMMKFGEARQKPLKHGVPITAPRKRAFRRTGDQADSSRSRCSDHGIDFTGNREVT